MVKLDQGVLVVTQRDIEEETVDRVAERSVGKLLSNGNVLTLLITLVMVGISWGIQTASLSDIKEDVRVLEARDMTPGAAAAVEGIRVFDKSLEQRVTNIESEMRNQRQEMMGYLQRIDQNVQAHTNSGNHR